MPTDLNAEQHKACGSQPKPLPIASFPSGSSETLEMIGLDIILPMTLFCFTAVATPGPNNIMLTASGVNYGFRRSIPHQLGIAIGFGVMNLAVGTGLGGVFETYPQIHMVLKYCAAAYLLYLAWKIARATGIKNSSDNTVAEGKPFTFIQAAAFQWVNPKAWAICISAVAAFTTVGGDLWREVALMSALFILVTLPSAAAWTFFGTLIARYLNNPKHRMWFNWSMAALLVLSLIPALG